MIEIINVSDEYKLRLQGWVQDASDFDNLWLFLNAFVANSPKFTTIKNKVESLVKPESLKTELISVMEKPALAYSYLQIVGKKNGSESRKTSTVCNGIGQAAMTGQVRPYLGDWPTNNFLRWAIVLDFIQRNDESETYSITPLGKQLALEESREKRLPILRKALLMYPPARRILRLLSENPNGLTKFELGEKLGCVGERGFTNIGQDLFEDLYLFSENIAEKRTLISDKEGSSDKYARQICSWLQKLKLVKSCKYSEKIPIQKYTLTPLGRDTCRQFTFNTNINVPFSLLSAENDGGTTAFRRAVILYLMQEKRLRSVNLIEKNLNSRFSISADRSIIEDDIKSIIQCGISMNKNDQGMYSLSDYILKLKIPRVGSRHSDSDIERIKNYLRPLLLHVDHDLLKIVDFAFDGANPNWLENYSYKVYKTFCTNVTALGGPNKPDLIAEYDGIGLIIDSKAYKNGFSATRSLKDEMMRYVNEAKDRSPQIRTKWWETFSENVKQLAFQYISSAFSSEIENQLEDISAHCSNIKGSAITAANLLLLAEKASSSKLNKDIFIRNQVIEPPNFQ